jgi:hypothetical protein
VRAARGHPLSKAQAAANRAKSRIRARIEHVFGARRSRAERPLLHRHRAGADQDRLAELCLFTSSRTRFTRHEAAANYSRDSVYHSAANEATLKGLKSS